MRSCDRSVEQLGERLLPFLGVEGVLLLDEDLWRAARVTATTNGRRSSDPNEPRTMMRVACDVPERDAHVEMQQAETNQYAQTYAPTVAAGLPSPSPRA
jgi:hypothetical protein